MDNWQMALTVLGILVAVLSVLAPALVYLGISLGTQRTSSSAAHNRIDNTNVRVDKLEILLREEFQELRLTMKESLESAWRNCPLATANHVSQTKERK